MQFSLNFLRLLWAPEESFNRLRERPDWLGPFLLTSIISIIVSIWLAPYAIEAVRQTIPPGTPDDQVERLFHQIGLGRKIGIFIGPLILFLKNLFTAIILTLVMLAITGEGNLKRGFYLFNYLNLIAVITSLCGGAIILVRGIDNIHAITDLRVPLGLNIFLHSESRILNSVLDALTPFEFWYLFLLIIGIKALFLYDTRRSIFIGCLYWLFAISSQIALGMLGTGASTNMF